MSNFLGYRATLSRVQCGVSLVSGCEILAHQVVPVYCLIVMSPFLKFDKQTGCPYRLAGVRLDKRAG